MAFLVLFADGEVKVGDLLHVESLAGSQATVRIDRPHTPSLGPYDVVISCEGKPDRIVTLPDPREAFIRQYNELNRGTGFRAE